MSNPISPLYPAPSAPNGAANLPFPWRLQPYNNITPFTIRDGESYLETLELLRQWLRETLTPYVDATINEYVLAFNSALDEVSKAFQDIIDYADSNEAKIDAKIAAFNQTVATATQTFNAAVAAANELIGDKVADATDAADRSEAARDLSQQYAANTVQLQDTSVAALLNDEASLSNAAYAQHAAQIGNVEAQVMLSQIPRRIMPTPPASAYGKGFGLDTGSRSPKISAGGTGYAVGDTILLRGGTYARQAYVTVTQVVNGAVTAVQTTHSGIYTVIPTDTLIPQDASSGAGTGVIFTTVNWTARPTAYKEGDYTDILPTDARMRFYGYGLTDLDGKGTFGNAPGSGNDSILEWDTDATRIEIHTKANRTAYTLFVDGQRITPDMRGQTDATGNFIIDQVAWTTKQMRSYRIVADRLAITAVRYANADGATFRAPTRTRPLVWSLGDSYMFGVGADNWFMNAFGVMCESLDVDGLPDGVSAARWDTSTAGDAVTRINNTLAKMNVKPGYIVWDLGYNNQFYQDDISVITTAMNNAINAAKQAAPNAKHIAISPATPKGDTAQLATLRTAMRGVYQTQNIPMVDVTNWVNVNNMARYTGADGIHPTNLGHYYLGARRAAAIKSLNLGL